MSTNIPKTVNKWLNNVQFWLLPPACILCRQSGQPGRDLCAACESGLPRLLHPCLRCALPLPPGIQGEALCGTCQVLPPPQVRLLAPFSYSPPLPVLVSAFKYHHRLVNGKELAAEACRYIAQHYRLSRLPDLMVPVPLHQGRLRERSYNQSLEIARWLSGPLQITIRHDLVYRRRETPQQAGLSAAARRQNLRGAFRMSENTSFEPGQVVAIVDDVVTTGTTIGELARVLLRHGAAEVHVWALARTIL